MKIPQPIEPPKKKVDRPQVVFELNTPEETELKKRFVGLVGHGGIKALLLQFMQRYVEFDGHIEVVAKTADIAVKQRNEFAITPDDNERDMVAALLRFLRDEKPGETYEQFLKGHKQTLESVLKPWMKNISKPKTSKGKKSESAA